ncbi:MAG TPA: thiol reductant ABC exporter subunit CydD [Acidisoma sp.]|uniref:thiol reductant ABC exporter subunit CydD n=1 Tax=Acidisoma sp. TaxID=1872115 RepID=UPI002CE42179|nr:thiol reductant ABC exporter subunit CydD [Acidisoma sp.]HTI02034.1 thiol reductant ABC exporter subunit CydD [Acidisoma sp.]
MIKRRRQVWLAKLGKAGGRQGRTAGLLLTLDSAAAIGFAAGLAYGLTALPHGLAAAAPWLALGAASGLMRGVSGLLSLRIGAAAARAAKSRLRDRITRISFALPQGERPQTGALMTAAVDRVETLDGYVARFLPARAAVAGTMVVLVATAAASPIGAAILGATLLPFIFLMILAGGAAADQAAAQFQAMMRLGALFADRIRGLPLILAFQAEGRETAQLARSADELRRRTMAVLRIAFISSAGLEFFAALAVALVAVYAGFNLLGVMPGLVTPFGLGHLDLARAFFILALAPEFYGPMRRLAAAYHDRQAAETAADGLMEIEERLDAAGARPARRLAAAPRIDFEAVTLRYPGEDRAALSAFSLTVAPGEIVALLAPSGGGKTSILNLLLGMVQPSAGRITVDGLTLAEGGGLAGAVGWMGQAPLVTAGTIAENIALVRRDASEEEILAAAEAAGLLPLLAARPAGLRTPLDERGGGLSGGERQRIGLARLFLKPEPLLLLDEPTAHLDAEAEMRLAAAIARAARGRTTLIATHSPRLAAIADRTIRLEAA